MCCRSNIKIKVGYEQFTRCKYSRYLKEKKKYHVVFSPLNNRKGINFFPLFSIPRFAVNLSFSLPPVLTFRRPLSLRPQVYLPTDFYHMSTWSLLNQYLSFTTSPSLVHQGASSPFVWLQLLTSILSNSVSSL